jgi:hypothetical protein
MTPKDVQMSAHWEKVSRELGLSVIAPYEVRLRSGRSVMVPALVRNFGARHGTLVVVDYQTIANIAGDLVEEGYGYSAMEPPGPHEDFDPGGIMAMLEDWGWSGPEQARPGWLAKADESGSDPG